MRLCPLRGLVQLSFLPLAFLLSFTAVPAAPHKASANALCLRHFTDAPVPSDKEHASWPGCPGLLSSTLHSADGLELSEVFPTPRALHFSPSALCSLSQISYNLQSRRPVGQSVLFAFLSQSPAWICSLPSH